MLNVSFTKTISPEFQEDKIYYKDGFKYQLQKDCYVQIGIYPEAVIETDWLRLSQDGVLLIRKGYAWDGPSGPTVDTKDFMRGSLVHDALYQLIRLGLLPEETTKPFADLSLKAVCRKDGMSWFRRTLDWFGLREFGWTALNPEAEKKVLTAP